MDNDKDLIILEDLDNIPSVDYKTAVILPDGRQGFLHPSGTIKDGRGLFMVQKQAGAVRAFDREGARAARIKRETLRSEAIQQAILNGTASEDLAGGIGKLAAAMVQIVLEGKQDRDKIKAFSELMRFGGLAYDLSRGGQAENGQGQAQNLSSEAVEALNFLLPTLEKRLKGG